MASVELLAGENFPDQGDDLQAALERLELPASAELLAMVELLADDELLGEGDDPQQLWRVSRSRPPLNSWQRWSCWPRATSLASAMTCRHLWSVSSSRFRLSSRHQLSSWPGKNSFTKAMTCRQLWSVSSSRPWLSSWHRLSLELLAKGKAPLAEDELLDAGDDPQAALERLELQASVELPTTVELLAEDEFPD